MYYGGEPEHAPRSALSGWCAAPMWLAFIPLLVLGLWWPPAVWTYLTAASRLLLPGAP
jgi:hydrogenase-4 component F